MKRILYITITSIIVVLIFTVLKYYTFGRVLPNANYGMRAICKLNDVSDVYIGSSMFRQGINARGISDKSFLLAYNSNKPCHEAMQLENLIENGAKFKRLIVDMYPYSMIRDAEISDVRMLMDGDIGFTWKIYSAMPKESKSLGVLYNMLVLQNNELFVTMPISYKLINSRSDRGSNTSISHGSTAEELMAKMKRMKEKDLEMKEIQIAGLDEMISLCRNNDIDIVFLETPKYNILYEKDEYSELMEDYVKLLMDRDIPMIISNKTREVVGVEQNNQLVQSYEFDHSNPLYFTDGYHISWEGRKEFTNTLREVLD